ncbi:hypothetical protein [Thalassiella azotivora]
MATYDAHTTYTAALRMAASGVVVEATVTDVTGGRWPRLEVRFPGPDGDTVKTFTTRFFEPEDNVLRAGDRVAVIYDPVDPTYIVAESWGADTWDAVPAGLAASAATAGAAILASAGLSNYLRRRKESRASRT